MSKDIRERYSKALRLACEEVLKLEPDLTMWDTEMGDGDCGETYANGAKVVLKLLDQDDSLWLEVLGISSERLGTHLKIIWVGLSCIVCNIFHSFIFFPMFCHNPARSSRNTTAQAVQSGLQALNRHTPARPGDRTLIDALHPFVTALPGGAGLKEAVKQARRAQARCDRFLDELLMLE